MAITVRTLYPNQLYQLRVTETSSDVPILTYTYATGLLSSDYLPSTAISILQQRWNLLVSGLDSSVVNNFANLLAALVHISDSGGELGIYYNGDGLTNFLYATDLSALNTYVINIGIPNSHEMWLTGGAATAVPI
jgi:hypothetical protein